MKFRRRQRADDQPGGEDAFLDIVANLVGILVILVMVIGVRAQDAWVESSQVPDPPPPVAAASPAITAQRDQALAQHASLELNVREVQQKTDELETLVDIRQNERHQLQVLLNAARGELDEWRASLKEDEQKQVAAATELRELEAQIERITQQQKSIEDDVESPIELEHLPTPLARTVFGNEEHFRLKHGRITYVPLNELTEMLKTHAPAQVHRLTQVREISETLGPIQGFHLTYTMHRRNIQTDSRVGPMTRQIAELKQFVLNPMNEEMGEPLAAAITPGSQFYQLVETFRPGASVVTVWTYPDSFEQFRQLKKWLYDRGFASAARPLPEGQPISGSPRGSRSAAQ